MTGTLVDSNVILDILTDDPDWLNWSAQKLSELANQSELLINPLIYAEISVRFSKIEDLEDALPTGYFSKERIPWEAGFMAGKAFLQYRNNQGKRRSPLPDFYIGAHAAVKEYRLLTRDQGRYNTYFPTVELVSP
jgi:predicted nucleic acid-binding protein